MPVTPLGLAVILASPSASRIRDTAARSRLVGDARDALRQRGHRQVEVIETARPDAIRRAIADAVALGAETVVLAGGDGTIRDASASLANTGVAVGILPCGTGNLFAASLGIPRDLDRAIKALATADTRPFDLGEVGLERPGAASEPAAFVVACGTGFDAHVMAGTSRESKQRYGVAAYFLAASRLLEHLRPRPTVITVDGQRTELESVVVLVASSGGAAPVGLRPRFPVLPDDGLLHAFVLPRGGVLGGIQGVLELALAGSVGRSATGAGVRLIGQHIRVEVEPAAPVEIDGDPFDPAVIDARVLPGALAVIRA